MSLAWVSLFWRNVMKLNMRIWMWCHVYFHTCISTFSYKNSYSLCFSFWIPHCILVPLIVLRLFHHFFQWCTYSLRTFHTKCYMLFTTYLEEYAYIRYMHGWSPCSFLVFLPFPSATTTYATILGRTHYYWHDSIGFRGNGGFVCFTWAGISFIRSWMFNGMEHTLSHRLHCVIINAIPYISHILRKMSFGYNVSATPLPLKHCLAPFLLQTLYFTIPQQLTPRDICLSSMHVSIM